MQFYIRSPQPLRQLIPPGKAGLGVNDVKLEDGEELLPILNGGVYMARKIVIKAVSNAIKDEDREKFRLNDEWVCIANEGTTTENMEGWILCTRKADGRHYNPFYFPAEVGVYKMNFKPGQLIFVMTGSGRDTFLPAMEGHPGQFHFFLNLDHFILDTPKDKINLYAFKKDGQKEIYELVDQKEIGG